MEKKVLNRVLVDASIAILAGLAIVATLGATGSSLTGDLTQECGNGVKKTSEQCDDGNTDSGDGCSSICKLEPGFQCDTNDNMPKSFCWKPALCGNGKKQGKEQCDDRNKVGGDGCDTYCNIESGFQCSGTPAVCQKCGNAIKEGTETCDDNNTKNGDGCSSVCKVEPDFECIITKPSRGTNCRRTCGNGKKGSGEQCEDGNAESNDGCSSICKFEPGFECKTDAKTRLTVCKRTCGDGVKGSSEQCDDKNAQGGDGCSSICKLEPGFECKTNNQTKKTVCKAICGNGQKQGDEQCDDGNTHNGDGCSSACKSEAPIGVCGNGSLEGGEQCDDENLTEGDGCSSVCKVERGYECNEYGWNCTAICGDGIRAGREQCDDKNLRNGDGCNDACTIEDVTLSVESDARAHDGGRYALRYELTLANQTPYAMSASVTLKIPPGLELDDMENGMCRITTSGTITCSVEAAQIPRGEASGRVLIFTFLHSGSACNKEIATVATFTGERTDGSPIEIRKSRETNIPCIICDDHGPNNDCVEAF